MGTLIVLGRQGLKLPRIEKKSKWQRQGKKKKKRQKTYSYPQCCIRALWPHCHSFQLQMAENQKQRCTQIPPNADAARSMTSKHGYPGGPPAPRSTAGKPQEGWGERRLSSSTPWYSTMSSTHPARPSLSVSPTSNGDDLNSYCSHSVLTRPLVFSQSSSV